jgi:hypothetical protein
MKVGEARQTYSVQIKAYQEQKVKVYKEKKALEEQIKITPNGKEVFANEAATLELTYNALDEKQSEYQEYMNQVMEQWSAQVNALSAKQQGEAMEEYSQDMSKVIEVARRIMKGMTVPATDEKKLMEFSSELYQAAKNIGMMAERRKKEKCESLWGDEKKEQNEDPMETADNMEAAASAPEIVSVEDTVSQANGESM